MGSRHVRGPLVFNTHKIVLSGNYTVLNESLVIVNKTVGAPTQITLPPSVSADGRRYVLVVDGKGDSATNPITIVPAGADTINGATALVIASGSAWTRLLDLGGGVWTTASAIGGQAGGVQRIVKALAGMADAADVALFTITVPNVLAGAGIRISLTGSLGDGDSTDTSLYNISVSRVAGAVAKAVAGTKFGTGATAGATANAVAIITIPAVTGGATAVNTFVVTARVTRSAGAAVNHFVTAEIEILNGNAGGVVVS